MRAHIILLIYFLFPVLVNANNITNSTLISIEDITKDMQNVFCAKDNSDEEDSDSYYFSEFLGDLKTNCLPKWNDSILDQALDGHYTAIINYYQTNPVESDPWINCILNSTDSRCYNGGYMESDSERWTVFGEATEREIVVMEPCNYVSNLAFLYSSFRVCEHEWLGRKDNNTLVLPFKKAIKRSFTILSAGSSFMHASHTSVGGKLDNFMIQATAFLAYEYTVSSLGWAEDTGSSNMIRCFNETFTCANSITIVDEVTSLPFDVSLENWYDTLVDLEEQIPPYSLVFAGILTIGAYLLFPTNVAEGLVALLADLLLASDPEILVFLQDVYIPEILAASSKVQISNLNKSRLGAKFVGVSAKLLYAFLWQENTLPFVPSTSVLTVGHLASPLFNFLATIATGYHDSRSPNIRYPGFRECNRWSPHSLWHQQAAEGLVELVMLCDEIVSVIE